MCTFLYFEVFGHTFWGFWEIYGFLVFWLAKIALLARADWSENLDGRWDCKLFEISLMYIELFGVKYGSNEFLSGQIIHI